MIPKKTQPEFFKCSRLRYQNVTPKMSDLLRFWFADTYKQYPSLNIGVDYFESFDIKYFQKSEKKYICPLRVLKFVHCTIVYLLLVDKYHGDRNQS